MTRREIRTHIFRMLFLNNFHSDEELSEQIKMYFDNVEWNDISEEIQSLLNQRYKDVEEHLTEIDHILEAVSEGWPIHRMNRVDLTILRLALFELKYDDEIPNKVAVNEAVELAKVFGGENSASFINGVLAKLI